VETLMNCLNYIIKKGKSQEKIGQERPYHEGHKGHEVHEEESL